MYPQYCKTQRSGFTLVEVLVSTVLIVAIMVLLLGTVDQTQRLWARSRAKATQFQSARAAFEVISRRLSQATLNTYWRASDLDVNTNQAHLLFRRQSELQFISGPMDRILDAKKIVPNLNGGNSKIAENYPTHGVFFSVPLGSTEFLVKEDEEYLRKFRELDSMMVACGYFIEFGDDPNVPVFLRDLQPKLPPRYRYRLMEMTVPAEKFNVFYRPPATKASPTRDDKRISDPRIIDEDENFYDGFTQTNRQLASKASFGRPYWMLEAFSRVSLSAAESTEGEYRFKHARPLAENIVAMIILPKLAVKDRVRPGSRPPVPDPDALELAPQYGFDSWRVLGGKVDTHKVLQIQLDNRSRDNLLPPTVQVTLVAIDELSAARMNLGEESEKPKWLDGLFRRATSEKEVVRDLQLLEKAIRDDPDHPNINYRIFTTDVVIRGSKWSRDPGLQF
jgi:uncharacterized protein (TIGR02599 family)